MGRGVCANEVAIANKLETIELVYDAGWLMLSVISPCPHCLSQCYLASLAVSPLVTVSMPPFPVTPVTVAVTVTLFPRRPVTVAISATEHLS